MKRIRRRTLVLLASGVVSWPGASLAVRLADDGLGQALIYPYYTVQQANGDAYNTYLSIVNHTGDAKALRLRFREGRASRETFSLNVYLAPHDTWTAAVVPDDTRPGFDSPPPGRDPARLITADASCTSPALPANGLPFQNAAYSGANDDGNGTGLDRAREGFIEVIEMATLTGAAAAAVTQKSTGLPANCAAVQGNDSLPAGAPSGGLSGTVTLINVQNGLNFDLNAAALADLSTKPFYRPSGDPYPDFNAAEIDPVSLVVANGAAYRATWSRPVDAVSAVLMSESASGEYVLDDATASNTDLVATFATRQFYVSATGELMPPFSGASGWAPDCYKGEPLGSWTSIAYHDREERSATIAAPDFGSPAGAPLALNDACAATVVIDVRNGSAHTSAQASTNVLGSIVRGSGMSPAVINAGFEHGWLRYRLSGFAPATLTSLASSTRMDLATGAVTTGPQTYYGLPMVGFTARTFVNGTLTCSAGACQGNYGGAFPLQYTRSISP